MSFLSGVYGLTVAIVAVLNGPVATVAWVGAVAVGLGWSVASMLPRRAPQAAEPNVAASPK